MSKKKKDDDDEESTFKICEVNISGVNYSVVLKSSRGETLKQMSVLGLNIYEHLLSLSDGYDSGVQ